MNGNFSEKQIKRLQHVNGHLSTMFDVKKMSSVIMNRLDHSSAMCLRFESFYLAKAIINWFSENDLDKFKQNAYSGALITKFYQLLMEFRRKQIMTVGSGVRVRELLLPLMSDNEPVINWLANNDGVFDLKAANNHKTDHFWAYQSRLALRGDWERLRAHCKQLLADPPKVSAAKKYLVDQYFYLALADGDMTGMEAALSEIVSPKGIRGRYNVESGFTQDLISTDAVVYAKIAWRHGYEVKVDPPYVPTEWLPVKPLASYEYPFPFVKELDVDSVEEFAKVWSKQ